MKTLNAKRITALAAGAALLGLGLAFAGPITFHNVPIISNSGQPVVQIVIGSTAKPIDGVTAANIAAAIGNLAYTSQPVTASVNTTQAKSVLHVSVSSASYTLSNPQIWLNQSGTTGVAAGTYGLYALIGSVLNRGLLTGAPQDTKRLQTSLSGYAYVNNGGTGLFGLTASPADSPYWDASGHAAPFRNPPTAAINGGGITFGTLSNTGDNIVQLTSSQIPGLLSNSGSYGESEALWLTGFPVYNQSNGHPPGALDVLSADGAYVAQFGKPIANTISSGAVNKASIKLVGANWTILNYYNIPATVVVGGSTAAPGGKIQLAGSLTPLTTVYVGHNLTSGPFTVQLTDLGQPNAGGVSPASLDIYYNGALTNVSQVYPGFTAFYNVTGHNLYVNVNQTFAGLYAYQKWAKMQLYNNVWNVTSGSTFNQTNDKNWTAILEWTNRSSGTKPDALAAIIIYGTSAASKGLLAGQSFDWITSPDAWKATFTGDTLLGSGNYDAVTFHSQDVGTEWYQNGAGTVTSVPIENLAAGTFTASGSQLVNDRGINESAAELVITSRIPNAFLWSGSQGSTVKWDLTPLSLTESHAVNSLETNSISATINAILSMPTGVAAANVMSTTYPLYVTVVGNQGKAATSFQFTFNGSGVQNTENSIFFDNVTGIVFSRPIPGLGATVNVVSTVSGSNQILASVAKIDPTILYPNTNSSSFQLISTQATVQYNQQNGESYTTWSLAGAQTANAGRTGHLSNYFDMNTSEFPVYPYSTSMTDNVEFGLVNNSGGIAGESAGPFFQVNYTAVPATGVDHGQQNNVTYISTQAHNVNAQASWITERGSKVAGISPGTVSVNYAKAVDTMKIVVGPTSTLVGGSATVHLCPGAGLPGIGLGQSLSVCGIANTTLAKVSANITVAPGANFSITGISNIKATPSVTKATTPVLLSSLATTAPIAVLDSGASTGSNLILIGSGFVNTLSAQLQTAYNISMTPTSQYAQAYGSNRILIAGYYGNQTNAAGKTFIQQLYAQASV